VGLRPLIRATRFRAKSEYILAARQKQDTLPYRLFFALHLLTPPICGCGQPMHFQPPTSSPRLLEWVSSVCRKSTHPETPRNSPSVRSRNFELWESSLLLRFLCCRRRLLLLRRGLRGRLRLRWCSRSRLHRVCLVVKTHDILSNVNLGRLVEKPRVLRR